MGDLLARLQRALGDAYRIEKELGGGGMSRLFLATEASLHRQVVIKLLPPEFASEVSATRFKQEIELAAHLQHPNILPVLTAGAKDDLLFYVMPFVSGESLRHRLTREGKLPVADAVRIVHEVADALAHAHAEGVIHRDIKPENILLEGGHAVLTDFGVARALAESRSGGRITDTGLALGTPGYMSPEQAAGERHIDARADVYALAVVGYEMLAGVPPFAGPTTQAVIAAHLTATPKPLTDVRPDTPPGVANVVARALAKDPNTRLRTAAEFRDAIGASAAAAPRLRVPQRALVGGAVAILVIVGAAALLWRSRAPPLLDPNVVAVFPFRVTGADPSLAYLHEGMVDLLAAELTGEGGPRAADPRSVLSAWKRTVASANVDLPEAAVLRLAQQLGAGQLLLGSIVGTPTRVVLNASLVSVPGGGSQARVRVEGPPDSLPSLVGQLAVQLLARGSGEPGAQVAALSSTSLPALRAYLGGRTAYRRGSYSEALERFEEALRFDSTFALAALDLQDAANWVADIPRGERALALAWAKRDRLSERDRALLTAYAGPNYPLLSSWADVTAAWERAVAAAPDRPESWWMLGDQPFFHQGRRRGLSDWRERAAAAFHRAVELDSGFAGPLEHLTELAVLDRDTAQVRQLGALYLARDSTGEVSDFMRWRIAVALQDSTALKALRARFEQVGFWSLARIVGFAQLDGIALEDAERAAQVLPRRAETPDQQLFADLYQHDLALNRGRPAAALALTVAMERAPYLFRVTWGRLLRHHRVWDALYGDGDTAAAGRAVARTAPGADGPLAADQSARALQYDDICTLEQWRSAHGEFRRAAQAIAKLRSAATPKDSAVIAANAAFCAAVLEAMLAARMGRPDAARVVDHLDSLIRAGSLGVAGDAALVRSGNMVVARLREAEGDFRSALAAVRRVPYHWPAVLYLSTFLREEGRLAALTGEREGAIKAYQHYLALRSDPEPALKPEVERVRAELAKLLGERATP